MRNYTDKINTIKNYDNLDHFWILHAFKLARW